VASPKFALRCFSLNLANLTKRVVSPPANDLGPARPDSGAQREQMKKEPATLALARLELLI
jgi:hypothetical protein